MGSLRLYSCTLGEIFAIFYIIRMYLIDYWRCAWYHNAQIPKKQHTLIKIIDCMRFVFLLGGAILVTTYLIELLLPSG